MTREQYAAVLMRTALDGIDDTAAVLAHFVQQGSADEVAELRAVLRRLPEDEES